MDITKDYEQFKKDIKILTKFEEITDEMHELYKIKNLNYGDSFSKSFNEYGLTMLCIRLEDKLNRLKSLIKQDKEANTDDESIRDTIIDISVYSVLGLLEIDKGDK